MSRVVVLVIDGLGCKYLGPYGNTWIETQAFNQLAADSLLLDGVYAPYADASKTIDAIWQAQSSRVDSPKSDVQQSTSDEATPAGTQVASTAPASLVRRVASRGVRTKLFSDDADLLDSKSAADFDEQFEVHPDVGLKLANEWDETHAARFFAQAIDAVSQLKQNELLWIHTRGLGNPWDAPYGFRAQFAEEEDPDPSGSAQVPSLELDEEYDPDALHDIQCALAGQIVLLDQCMGVLMSVLQTEASDVMFMLTSPRGFPMGEHRRVGWESPTLHHELLSVPGFLRFPERRYALRRHLGLLHTTDLSELLLDWYESPDAKPGILDTDSQRARSYSISQGDNDTLLRTPSWQLRFVDFESERGSAELYLRPDDQNEVNDVADRCADVVEAGRDFLRELMGATEENRAAIELPDILRDSPE